MKTSQTFSKALRSRPLLTSQKLQNRTVKRTFMMTSRLDKEPRRFAPLRDGTGGDKGSEELPKLNGIVFDVDGTLW